MPKQTLQNEKIFSVFVRETAVLIYGPRKQDFTGKTGRGIRLYCRSGDLGRISLTTSLFPCSESVRKEEEIFFKKASKK